MRLLRSDGTPFPTITGIDGKPCVVALPGAVSDSLAPFAITYDGTL
jgi:hypothetical protein